MECLEIGIPTSKLHGPPLRSRPSTKTLCYRLRGPIGRISLLPLLGLPSMVSRHRPRSRIRPTSAHPRTKSLLRLRSGRESLRRNICCILPSALLLATVPIHMADLLSFHCHLIRLDDTLQHLSRLNLVGARSSHLATGMPSAHHVDRLYR